MQCYAKLYHKKYMNLPPDEKIKRVRRIMQHKLPPLISLALIALVIKSN